jgi:hypothetical protein
MCIRSRTGIQHPNVAIIALTKRIIISMITASFLGQISSSTTIMPSRLYYLLSSRQSPQRQRAHFALWSPYPNSPCGTKLHVTGTPFTGYALEFKRGYNPSLETERFEMFEVGMIDEKYMYDHLAQQEDNSVEIVVEKVPRCDIEEIACTIPPPGKCRDVFAHVDEVR